jgi:LysM repeat protein/lipopolysaccharide biosynthesis regulator YciM
MHSKGLPRKNGIGQASIADQKSPYSGNWEKFFHDYQVPLEIKAPVRFSFPEFPLLPEKLISEDVRDVWKVAHAEGWGIVEPLLEMKAKTNIEFEKSEVFQTIRMEARARSGNYKAVLSDVFEPEEPSLITRCQYLKSFSRAALSDFYLARINLGTALESMKTDDPFRPYFLLLQAEIALSLDQRREALATLSHKDTAWVGDLEKIRQLRLVDSKNFKSLEKKPNFYGEKKVQEKASPAQTVTVKAGDSWWSLSQQTGVSVADLKKLNNVSGDILQIGQQLVVSAQKEMPILKEMEVEKVISKKKPWNPYTPFLKDNGFFFKKPFSLCRAADLFQKQGQFDQALFLYEKAKMVLEDNCVKALVDFSTARLLKKIGKADMALERLQTLVEQKPAAEPAFRARLAMIEDEMSGKKEFSYLKMADEYTEISDQARPRGLRESASFKNALALYFGGKKEESIQAFDDFRKNFSAGGLVKEAEAFLQEKLPAMIEKMGAQGRDFDAIVLLDKHREILLPKQKDSSFLIHLADSLWRLGLMKRTAKIYLFLLENYQDRDEEKLFYLPLVNTYMERQEYSASADFAGRYIKRFPDGEDWQKLYYLQMLAFRKAELFDDAIAAWNNHRDRADTRVRMVAAQVFWEKERYQEVLDCLKEEPQKGKKFPDDILILQAESYLKQKQKKEAFALFQELSESKEFSQQSLFRCAQIAMSSGDKKEALNYLNQVVEKGTNSFWDDLARTSMVEMKM